MSTPVLIMGKSGTGKSRAIGSLDPATTFLINVIGKDLPFRGWKKKYTLLDKKGTGNMINTDSYETIAKTLTWIAKERPENTAIVIDDFQYLMADEFMRRASEKGYEKFTEIGKHAWELLWNSRFIGDNRAIFFLSHSDINDLGEEKVKTIGKLLDEKICVEGMFSIVLNTFVDNGNYYFETQNNGHNTTKSPEGMFESLRIPNDLKYILDSITKWNEGE